MPKNRSKTAVLTLVLASMIISGCTNGGAAAQTTTQTSAAQNAADNTDAATSEKDAAQAYLDALKTAFHKYAEANSAYVDNLEAEKFEASKAYIDDMEKALDELGNIAAPEKYSANHARLRGNLTAEYDYLRLSRRFIEFCEKGDSLTEDDKVELDCLTKELSLTNSGFSDEFLSLVKTVKADLDK